jgi:CBS-domain-containing membrane protein
MIPKSRVEYITTQSTVRQALEKMRYHHYVAIPVIDEEGMYVGTLRNDDIFKYILENGYFDYRAAEQDSVMSILDKEYSKPLYHSASVNELINNVMEHNFVPVIDDRGCFIGMILRRDVLNFLLEFYEEKKKD